MESQAKIHPALAGRREGFGVRLGAPEESGCAPVAQAAQAVAGAEKPADETCRTWTEDQASATAATFALMGQSPEEPKAH